MTVKKQKIISVIGTRPDAIKMAPVLRALSSDDRFDSVIVNTGQHKDMIKGVLEWFNIEPHYTLDVMEPGQPLSYLAGKVMAGLHDIFVKENPHIVAVHGDTTTGFVAALAAHYCFNFNEKRPIRVAHVEAGLRTDNLYAPYPEEGNRRLIAPLAYWHFAPTETAAEALFEENVTGNVFITGNSVVDALYDTVDLLKANPRPAVIDIPKDKKMLLVTGHRRENYGDGFDGICEALKQLAEANSNLEIVYPVHMNPVVKEAVESHLSGIENIKLIEPQDYPDFVALMERSDIILTDSGGLQEEAPALGKPVLVMRDVTERPDAVLSGTVKLVGTKTERIVPAVQELLDSEVAYRQMSAAANPYGDGLAAQRIVNILSGGLATENTFHAVA
ncbi:MAG: UDP-N-acetylglucosamine 2-epimerase (non-hydrolyzing) [Alphaproteobacteria bacterium]|nr:UDP-N-acetylglucosamine 2-epimerase (non-hydrolyzing) [Alphaproteobacteria bacterium]